MSDPPRLPRWFVIWWWLAAPWPIILAGKFAYRMTITRWRTGWGGPRFGTWGDEPQAFLFPLDVLCITIWVGLALIYALWLLRRHARVPRYLILGMCLLILAGVVARVPDRVWEDAVVATSGPGKFGGTLLARAALNGDTIALSSLIAGGVSIEAVASYPVAPYSSVGETALMTAAQQRQPVAVRYLLDHGADPDHGQNYGANPLTRAISGGDVSIVRMLLEHGADPTLPRLPNQVKVIEVARYSRDTTVIRLIQEAVDSVGRARLKPIR